MTNIKQKVTLSNVKTHIEKAFEIIDEFLPSPYVDKVLAILPEPKPKKSYVRNVRYRVTAAHDNRIDIINALLQVAKDNKAAIEKLIESTSEEK
jgi:hypothetical protein